MIPTPGQPAPPTADLQAAMRAHRAGQLDQARTLYERIIASNPANHAAMVLLAQVHLAQGKPARAIELIERALTLTPDHPGYLFQLASALLSANRIKAARDAIERSVQRDPNHAQSQALLGVVLDRMLRPDQAESAHARARTLLAGRGDQLKALARTLEQAGSIRAARDALIDAAGLLPDDAQVFARLRDAEHALLNIDAAIDAAQRVVQLVADQPGPRVRLAALLEHAGRLDEAQTQIDAALVRAPDDLAGATLAQRIARRRGQPGAFVDRLLALADARSEPVELVSAARVELGHTLDALGRYDEAFAHFATGKAAWASTPQAQRFPLRTMHEGLRANLDQALSLPLDRVAPPARDPDAPVFFLGFPRSGTTLTERILDAHPRLVGTDEAMLLSNLFIAARELVGADDPYTVRLEALTESHITELRARYQRDAQRALGAERIRGCRVVDKLPLNVHRLGLIRCVFPESPILFALRDPRDCCLSCFMQDFSPNAAMVHFCSIKTTAQLYDATLGAWCKLRDGLGLRWFESRYEDLVADLEGSARAIIEFLGEPWTDEVLAFQRREPARALSTPSYAAVTRPVTSKAVGRWTHYREHLGPMLEILSPWVDRLGYPA